jgi:hypothetical protein
MHEGCIGGRPHPFSYVDGFRTANPPRRSPAVAQAAPVQAYDAVFFNERDVRRHECNTCCLAIL